VLESTTKGCSADRTIPWKIGTIGVECHNDRFFAAIGASAMVNPNTVITRLGKYFLELISL